VALVNGEPVGRAAIQRAGPATAELKRMYVTPASRGQGIARALLAGLEELASNSGYQTLRLATGVRQPEAMRLYESCGYVPAEPYGKYVDEPLIRCYQKVLPGELPAVYPDIGAAQASAPTQ
jgi:putative acetyltransferase